MASQSAATQSSLIDVDPVFSAPSLEDVKYKEVRLKDLGHQLPVGLFVDGERLRDVVLKPYRNSHDRILGQLTKDRPDFVRVVQHNEFLPKLVESIGGYPIPALADRLGYRDRPGHIFSGMLLGDLTTLLCLIRRQAQDSWAVAMSGQCPACQTMNTDGPTKGYHDLSSLVIRSYESLSQPLRVCVHLQDGFEVDGELCKRLVMEPMKTHQVKHLTSNKSTNAEDIEMLYAMVAAVDAPGYRDTPRPFGNELYDELTRADTNLLLKVIKDLQPGPDLRIEMDCYKCHYEWKLPVPWGDLRQFLFIAPDATD